MNITIYTNSTCGYCKQLKDELNKNDIEFKEKLISEFTVEWQDIVNLTGLPTTPTIKYTHLHSYGCTHNKIIHR